MQRTTKEQISDIVGSFKQLPYLFVGTGLSMRYANALSWETLLYTIWCEVYDDNRFKFEKALQRIEYELSTSLGDKTNDQKKYYVFPKLASELQERFNTLYFTEEAFEQKVFTEIESQDIVKNKYDPFKYYISRCTAHVRLDLDKLESAELKHLVENQNKIAGIITTNYDTCLESIFDNFDVIVGQENMLISNVNNAFEIYKIHGSSTSPNSLVFTQQDYEYFDKKLKYLSAKLLTIFVEHPIIFLGYGMGDPNIQEIFMEIAQSVSSETLQNAKENFIFITPAFENNEEIKTREFICDSTRILMTELILKDYATFYNELNRIPSSMPVKLMRKMQNMVTNFIYSTTATNNVIFGSINSPDIDDDKAAIYVGRMDTISQLGFDSFGIMDIMEDILFDNKPFLVDDKLIEKTFKNIRSVSGSTYLPIYKYIRLLNMELEQIPSNYLIIKSLQDVKPNSSERNYIDHELQVNKLEDILIKYPNHLPKQFANIKQFANKIDVDDLGSYLKEHHKKGTYFDSYRISGFKKLTALYDYLKYKK